MTSNSAYSRVRTVLAALLLMALVVACSSGAKKTPTTDGDVETTDGEELASADGDTEHADVEPSVESDAETNEETDAEPEVEQAVEAEAPFSPDAAAAAFKLYYRERVDRAVVAFNRFQLFGDTGFGVTIGKAGVARSGDAWEIVPGPNDNNNIGFSVWTTQHAYKLFRTRTLALSLVRMFNGLTFMAEASGHPGVTSRHAYPGWTMIIDGPAATVSRTRAGTAVWPVHPVDANLEKELIAAFFPDGTFTYREEPDDFMFSYMPGVEPGAYSVTYSFSMLPRYIRVSDCCATLMRTPAPYAWEGAFWSNHNSRDNHPDLALGYLAALAVTMDAEADPEVRAAAQTAWQAAHTVADLIWTNGGRIMTVAEYSDYADLTVAGAIRPDGETEDEDLGSMADCSMAYVLRALSSEGLTLPLPSLPMPGAIDRLMDGLLDECVTPTEELRCQRLGEAFCGKDWANIGELHFFGTPWLELALELDLKNPGAANKLIGSFQDDYFEQTLAMLGVSYYARLRGDEALAEEASVALKAMTDVMRNFADIIYERAYPTKWTERRYEAGLLDAWGDLDVLSDDLGDFSRAESQTAYLESWLTLADTTPWTLYSDEEVQRYIDRSLSGKTATVKNRYAEHYGDQAPVRRADDEYEARYHHPDIGVSPWAPVEHPRHKVIGGVKLLEAVPLCVTRPDILDCTWARLGCQRPDLDADGAVDADDQSAFTTLSAQHEDVVCGESNTWCGGADLDRSGAVDATDAAFMTAAQGCWYER